MTFTGAQALVNRLTSGTWSTMEIIRESSGINWVWLRTLFKGTPFSPLDIIGDHSEGGGGGGGGFDGWRQLLVFAPVLTLRKRTCHSNNTSSLTLHTCIGTHYSFILHSLYWITFHPPSPDMTNKCLTNTVHLLCQIFKCEMIPVLCQSNLYHASVIIFCLSAICHWVF